MTHLIAGLTVSLDGFVADEFGRTDALYPDLEALHGTPYMDELIAQPGAVLIGRRAIEMADDPDWYAGNYASAGPTSPSSSCGPTWPTNCGST